MANDKISKAWLTSSHIGATVTLSILVEKEFELSASVTDMRNGKLVKITNLTESDLNLLLQALSSEPL
jgi:hypothetical protein